MSFTATEEEKVFSFQYITRTSECKENRRGGYCHGRCQSGDTRVKKYFTLAAGTKEDPDTPKLSYIERNHLSRNKTNEC